MIIISHSSYLETKDDFEHLSLQVEHDNNKDKQRDRICFLQPMKRNKGYYKNDKAKFILNILRTETKICPYTIPQA